MAAASSSGSEAVVSAGTGVAAPIGAPVGYSGYGCRGGGVWAVTAVATVIGSLVDYAECDCGRPAQPASRRRVPVRVPDELLARTLAGNGLLRRVRGVVLDLEAERPQRIESVYLPRLER